MGLGAVGSASGGSGLGKGSSGWGSIGLGGLEELVDVFADKGVGVDEVVVGVEVNEMWAG